MNPHLPNLWSIYGCEDAEGYVFRDPLSAKRWLQELMGKKLMEKALTKRTMRIEPAKVIYYGSNLTCDMRTTEQVRADILRNA